MAAFGGTSPIEKSAAAVTPTTTNVLPQVSRNGLGQKRKRIEFEFTVAEFLQQHPEDSEESMILGIDEAGRGPVIGSMLYAGAMISLKNHDGFIDCGVADSKTLNEDARDKCFSKLMKQEGAYFFVRPVSAERIAEVMSGRSGHTLNTLSHNTAIDIIREAVLQGKGKLSAVYVDTVGNPEAYQRLLRGRFPHLTFVVTSKADSRFPVVSAASVVAKTFREKEVRGMDQKVGCGYPSDPRTVAWIRTHLHRFFLYNEPAGFVRHTWAPVMALAKEACAPLRFEQDDVNEEIDPKQKQLSFSRQPPRRDSLFVHVLGLQTTYAVVHPIRNLVTK